MRILNRRPREEMRLALEETPHLSDVRFLSMHFSLADECKIFLAIGCDWQRSLEPSQLFFQLTVLISMTIRE